MTFRTVRQGSECDREVVDRDGLITLRTELELLALIGQGQSRLAYLAVSNPAEFEDFDTLTEIRDLLNDSLSPLVNDAIVMIDETFPQLVDELCRDVLVKEAKAVQRDVVDCLRRGKSDQTRTLADTYADSVGLPSSSDNDQPIAPHPDESENTMSEHENTNDAVNETVSETESDLTGQAPVDELAPEDTAAATDEGVADGGDVEDALKAMEDNLEELQALADPVDEPDAAAEQVADDLEAIAAEEQTDEASTAEPIAETPDATIPDAMMSDATTLEVAVPDVATPDATTPDEVTSDTMMPESTAPEASVPSDDNDSTPDPSTEIANAADNEVPVATHGPDEDMASDPVSSLDVDLEQPQIQEASTQDEPEAEIDDATLEESVTAFTAAVAELQQDPETPEATQPAYANEEPEPQVHPNPTDPESTETSRVRPGRTESMPTDAKSSETPYENHENESQPRHRPIASTQNPTRYRRSASGHRSQGVESAIENLAGFMVNEVNGLWTEARDGLSEICTFREEIESIRDEVARLHRDMLNMREAAATAR
ncbi:MAG: hypothetical protein GXP29_01250, partial [Planctomycetes bacterium]|nr:hypothetical protein [Planctomycetota bacterium]